MGETDATPRRRWPGRAYLVIVVGAVIYAHFALRAVHYLSFVESLAFWRDSTISMPIFMFQYWDFVNHGAALLVIIGLLSVWLTNRSESVAVLRLIGFYLVCECLFFSLRLLHEEVLFEMGAPNFEPPPIYTATTYALFLTWRIGARALILIAGILLFVPMRIGGAIAIAALAVSLPLTAGYRPALDHPDTLEGAEDHGVDLSSSGALDSLVLLDPEFLFLSEPNWARLILYAMCAVAVLLYQPQRAKVNEE